ncbi:hypothetical protein [Pelagibacterium mangrovi]|uniref:hypothetical protein n=1 Tax=Pelagibacterium mangrovi TaxID=3119828 RepID=UPI002FC5FC76
MVIQQSSQIVLHRLASLEARSLDARGALIAKHLGEVMNRQAVERLDAPSDTGGTLDRRV